MERIGVRELRQNASRYLELVRSGETVEITDRGSLIALLVPPAAGTASRERLIADGRLIPSAANRIFPQPVALEPGSIRTADLLADLREDRA